MEVLSYQVDGRQCLLAGVNLKRDAAPDAARRRWGLPGASPAGSSGVCSSRLTASREESCSPGSPRTQQETGGAPYQPYAGLFAGPLTRNPETPQHPSSREGPIRGSGVRLGAAASRTPSDPPGCARPLLVGAETRAGRSPLRPPPKPGQRFPRACLLHLPPVPLRPAYGAQLSPVPRGPASGTAQSGPSGGCAWMASRRP